jgi:hypothetical protein
MAKFKKNPILPPVLVLLEYEDEDPAGIPEAPDV